MRRALLRMLAMTAGGLPPRRPDQVEPDTFPGVGPGSASRVIQARQVIIFGTGISTGMFVYNGQPAGPAPGPANPPQVAIVNSSATRDPYGNPITSAKILVQANVITESGGIFRTAAAAPLLQLDGPHDAFFLYNASAVLVASDAGAAGNDGIGDAFLTGRVAYSAAGAARLAVQLGSGTGTQQAVNFYTAPGVGGPWTLKNSIGIDTINSVVITGGALALPEGAAPAVEINPQVFGNAAGHIGVVSDNATGDSNTYDTERLTLVCAATTINSSTVRVNVFSKHLGVGTYKIHMWIVTQNTTAADFAHWSFAFTGTATGLATFTTKSSGTAVVGFAATTTPFGTLGDGQATGGNQSVECDVTLTVTVAGTFTFGGLESVSGNTVTVSAGGEMDIYPVVAT